MAEDRGNISTFPSRKRPHQFIFLNGPPKSGKDTAVNMLTTEFITVRHRKFSGPLKASVAGMFNLSPELISKLEAPGSKLKDNMLPELMGKSWRDTLIWFSESIMKPNYGPDIFGKLMVTELGKQTASRFTAISDSGFELEALPVIKAYGPQNCHIIRLYRPGYSFAGDSRSYIFENNVPEGLTIYDIHNEYELDIFKAQILRTVRKILGIPTEG